MGAVGQVSQGMRKYCGRWLILLVVVGVLLVFGIFRMLFQTPGEGDTVIEQHPNQIIK